MKKLCFTLIAAVYAFGNLWAREAPSLDKLQYWVDNDLDAAIESPTMEFDLDCSALSDGCHTLHYRVSDSDGRFSHLHEHTFFKFTPPAMATTIETLQYWWDNMTTNILTMPYTGDEVILSVNAFSEGLHTLSYRVKDNTGKWSQLKTHYFYRTNPADKAKIISYTYWWNDMDNKAQTVTLDEPLSTFVLDQDFLVPDDARTNFAGHYAATLNFAITDSRGRSILTCATVNYPDNDCPATDIDADKYVSSSTVTISWEELSGDLMGDYNVYVSKDGAPFLLWLPDTKLNKATFKGELGSVYLFTVTGRDFAGNREKFDETKCVSVTFE